MQNVLDSLKAHSDGLSVCWLGNDGWLISHNGHLVGIDLDLCNSLRKSPSPVTPEEVGGKLDYLLVTHDHDDHFNLETCTRLADHGDTIFVLPESCAPRWKSTSIPESRIRWVSPRNQYTLADWLSIQTVRALHGHHKQSVYEHANTLDCGYLIRIAGKVLYQPGDTVLLSEQLEMTDVDILFISPTEHNTLVEDSVLLIESINPAHVFAQHFDTYAYSDDHAYWVVGYPNEVKDRLSPELSERMIIPRQGVVYHTLH